MDENDFPYEVDLEAVELIVEMGQQGLRPALVAFLGDTGGFRLAARGRDPDVVLGELWRGRRASRTCRRGPAAATSLVGTRLGSRSRPAYDGPMEPEQVVRDFCETVRRVDVKALLAFFTEDAVYHNIPVDPVQGLEAIESTLNQFMTPGGEASFELKAIATSGNKVLTERVDVLTMGGKRVEIPVMGTFEITPDGKISAWRDYFDMQQVVSQMS